MNKQAKFILPLVISGLLLTACVNDKPSSTSSVEPSNNVSSSIDDAFGSSTISFTPISISSISVEPVLGIRSLKEGLQKIYGTKNYTIDVSLNYQPYYSVYFNENYIGTDSSGAAALDLKIFDGVGIYPLNYTNEEFVSGEYYCDENGIRYKDLYDNKLVSSLYHIDEAFVNGVGDVGEEPVKITGKKYKMQLLTSIGIDSSFYLQLNSATASYKEGKVIFDLAFEGGYNYSLTVRDFGTTSNRHYNEFMDEGGKMTQPSETLQEFRELMKMDNFRRYVYDFDAGGYTQTENFHQHYFYTQAIGSNDIYGYMSMNTKANEEHPDLKGCYYFYTSNGTPHFNSMAFNENPDIPMFFHYPKYMDLLNKLHFIVEGTSGDIKYEAGTKKYMVYDKTLIEDFAHNFSLDQAWDLGTCVPYGLGIETKIVEGSPDKSIINFHYLFKNKGDTYSYKIPMFDFGKVKVDGLDEIYDYYND